MPKSQTMGVMIIQILLSSLKMMSKLLMMEKSYSKHPHVIALFVSTWQKTKKSSKMNYRWTSFNILSQENRKLFIRKKEVMG
jgi:hypothetical protein